MNTQENNKKIAETKNNTIYYKAVELYVTIGVSAVCDYANELGLPYEYCEPCENEMPTLDRACLVCGTDNLLTNKNK